MHRNKICPSHLVSPISNQLHISNLSSTSSAHTTHYAKDPLVNDKPYLTPIGMITYHCYFKGNTIGLKSIIKLPWPITSLFIHRLSQNYLNIPIWHFYLPAYFGLIRSFQLMFLHSIFSKATLNTLLQKWESPSLMIMRGVPKCEIIFFFKNDIILFPSLCANSTASIHL